MSNQGLVNLIGVVGAAMGGYTKGKRDRERDDMDKAEREQEREMRGLRLSEAKQRQQDATDLRDAAKPIPVQMNTPGDGMGPTAFVGGGDSFGTQEAADKTLNSPKAVMGRQRAVLDRTDPTGAPGRALADTQAQTAQLTLDEATQTTIKRRFDDLLGSLGTHDAIAGAVSDSKHDGMGGGLKVKAVPSADGRKVQYRQVMEDGTTAASGPEFDNTPDGLLGAKAYLSRNMSISDKLNHMHQAHQDRVAQQNADSAEQWRKDQAELLRNKVDKTGRAGSAFDRMDEVDKMTYQSLNSQISETNKAILKAQAEGTWDENSANAKAIRESLVIAQNQARAVVRKYVDDAPAADPFGLRGDAQTRDDPSAPPSFDVNGDPGAFRKRLAASKSPNREAVLAAFDKQYPQAKPKVTKEAVLAQMGGEPTRAQLMRQASQSKPPSAQLDLKKVVRAQMGQGLSTADIESLNSFNR